MGCSGWSYKDWRGRVYPSDAPPREWFAYYAERFDTVEINNTFYKLPAASTVDGWAAQAPEGFIYAVKVGQFGSHRMKLRDAPSWLSNHVERVEHLGEALGPNLIQLPPRWRRDAARLDEMLAAAPTTIRWAVELRDRSWLHDEVFEVLRRHSAALCIHDLIECHPWELTAGWTYVRFHGPQARERSYEGRYGGRRLWRPAERLGEWLDGGFDVFAYFNNDVEAHAVQDATWMAGRLSDARGPSARGSSRGPRRRRARGES